VEAGGSGYRSMQQCPPAGTGAVRIVRRVTRPWARSTVWCAGGKHVGGQLVDRGHQARLVVLHREHVVSLPVFDQPAGVLGVGMERILCRGGCYAEVVGDGRCCWG
jgi:hypothetical protein